MKLLRRAIFSLYIFLLFFMNLRFWSLSDPAGLDSTLLQVRYQTTFNFDAWSILIKLLESYDGALTFFFVCLIAACNFKYLHLKNKNKQIKSEVRRTYTSVMLGDSPSPVYSSVCYWEGTVLLAKAEWVDLFL